MKSEYPHAVFFPVSLSMYEGAGRQVPPAGTHTRRSAMKTQSLTPKLLAAAAAGSLFFSGCLRDENPTDDGSSEGTVLVEGRMQGETAMPKVSALGAGSAGLEGAVVTVARLEADGSMRTVSTSEVKTDAQGRFSIRAVADDSRELIVRAKQSGKEWKAVVSAKAEKGKTV